MSGKGFTEEFTKNPSNKLPSEAIPLRKLLNGWESPPKVCMRDSRNLMHRSPVNRLRQTSNLKSPVLKQNSD